MSHHLGNERTSLEWATISNDLVHRVTEMYPDNFAPVCMLPQSPGAPPANSVPELRRCVEELGFVGVNVNPDPTGGYWTGKPFTDREWYPLFEAMVELDVPGMVHVAASCNPELPRHRRALSQRRHFGVHAAPPVGPCSGTSRPCASSSRTAAARCLTIGVAIAA